MASMAPMMTVFMLALMRTNSAPRSHEKEIFELLYKGFKEGAALEISMKERQEIRGPNIDPSQFVYGEMEFENFALIFSKLRERSELLHKLVVVDQGVTGQNEPNKLVSAGKSVERKGSFLGDGGGTFYDLGSGSGKPSFSAALLHNFTNVGGVEILPGLIGIANKVKGRWQDLAKENGVLSEPQKQVDFNFVAGDATSFDDLDWSDGDCIFTHATCFPEDMRHKIVAKAETLKPGSVFVTVSQTFTSPNDEFDLIESFDTELSWGNATVYIHEKKNDLSRLLQHLEQQYNDIDIESSPDRVYEELRL
jgi:hypothetical protein